MQYKGLRGPAVTLDQEVGRREELSKPYWTGFHFLEDIGAATFGKCNGEKVFLLVLAYRVGGSAWGVEDTIINATTFFAVPYDRQKMEDNEFISHRVEPFVRHDDFKIIREPDRVIWQAGERQHICRPPYWDIKGLHLGVDVDITMEQIGSPDWYLGTWEDLPKNGCAGRGLWARTTGTIKAGGKVYTLEKGSVSDHDHAVSGERLVADAEKSSVQYFYHVYRSEELQILVYFRPAYGQIYGRVVFADGKEIYYDANSVSVKEEEYWLDPQTHVQLPVLFRVDLKSPEGNVQLNLRAYGRALYAFSFSMTLRTHFDLLVHSEGRFIGPDGQSIAIMDGPDDVGFCEWGFTTPLGNGGTVTRPR